MNDSKFIGLPRKGGPVVKPEVRRAGNFVKVPLSLPTKVRSAAEVLAEKDAARRLWLDMQIAEELAAGPTRTRRCHECGEHFDCPVLSGRQVYCLNCSPGRTQENYRRKHGGAK